MFNPESYYLDLFQVTPGTLEELTGLGIKEGGSYCDLFFENTTYHELLLRDGIVSSGGFHIDYGVCPLHAGCRQSGFNDRSRRKM